MFAICPRFWIECHQLRQNHFHTIQDLPWNEKPVYLRVNSRQLECNKCGKPFTAVLEFPPSRRSYTKRFALDILRQVLESNILAISQRVGISEYRIQHILEGAGKVLKQMKPKGLKIFGIDEISWVKGGKYYCWVIVNLATHEAIGLVKSRKQDETVMKAVNEQLDTQRKRERQKAKRIRNKAEKKSYGGAWKQ